MERTTQSGGGGRVLYVGAESTVQWKSCRYITLRSQRFCGCASERGTSIQATAAEMEIANHSSETEN